MWFFMLCGFLAFAGKPVSSSCPIEMSPPEIVMRFGDSLSVNCSLLSGKEDEIGWESTYGGTGLLNVSSLPLNIDSVAEWEFRPHCFRNSIDGDQCEKTLPVTVYKMPDSVSMSETSQVVYMKEGDKLSVQCDIVDVAPVRHLSVLWYKGNNIFYTDSYKESTLKPVNKSSLGNLIARREDNGTHIWCEAKLDFGPVGPNVPAIQSTSRELIVLYPPVFHTPENQTLEVGAGSKAILNCTAAANPEPVYRWHFPQPIQRKSKDQNENEPVLTPSFQLPGIYSCIASNRLGQTTKYFRIVEAARDRTTFAALVGGFVSLGVLLAIVGLVFVTPQGTFSFSKGNYLRGRPTSSGPV